MPRQTQGPRLCRINGRRAYHVRWTDPESGRSRLRSTHTEDPEEAEAWLDAFKDARAAPKGHTIKGLLVARLEDAKGRVAAYNNLRLFHKQLTIRLGHLTPEEFTRGVNRRYIEKRPKAAARRELQELRSTFIFSRRQKWIETIPDVLIPPANAPRELYLDRDQAPVLLRACKSRHVHIFMLLAMTTGARKGAILDLTWDRVDLARGVIDYRRPGKPESNKRRGIVPMDKRVALVLREAQEDARSKYVVELARKQVKDIKKGFALTAGRAGLDWVTPHVLKHSFVSWMAEDGKPLDWVSMVTMTDEKTLRRIYRKFQPEALAPLAEAAADIVFGGSANGVVSTSNGEN